MQQSINKKQGPTLQKHPYHKSAANRNKYKLAHTRLTVDYYLLPTSKSRDTKNWDKNPKLGPNKLQVLYPSLKIRVHLPTPL